MAKLREKATKAKSPGKLRKKAASRGEMPQLNDGEEREIAPTPGVASETQFNQPPPPPPPLAYFAYYSRIPGLRQSGNK